MYQVISRNSYGKETLDLTVSMGVTVEELKAKQWKANFTLKFFG